MTRQQFEAAMASNYVKIECNTRNGPLLVIFIAEKNDLLITSAKFEQFLDARIKAFTGSNIVIVTHTELSKSLEKKTMTRPGRIIETYAYDMFAMVVPKHIMQPKFEIVSADEVRTFCDAYHTCPENFPIIRVTDPMCVWHGIRPGTVVKVTRSTASLAETVYKRCV